MKVLLLDACILSRLCNPKANRSLATWFSGAILKDPPEYEIIIPGIADYETRRGLLWGAHHHHDASQRPVFRERVDRLDGLRSDFDYVPLSDAILKRAARLCADAKASGRRTASEEAIDGDAILASQVLETGGEVVTRNRKHLAVYGVPIFPIEQHVPDGDRGRGQTVRSP